MRVLLRPDHLSPAECIRLLHLTLDKLGPPASDTTEAAARLRTGLGAIASGITETSSRTDLENTLTAAAELIRKHYGAAGQRALEQIAEVKSVMRTMTNTIAFLSESRSTVVHQFMFLERQLEEATELDDVRLLRPRLEQCLQLVRKENARLQSESLAHTESIRTQMGIPSSAAPVRQIGVVDLATGLPGRTAGEILLAEKAVGGMCCSLGLFVAENVRSIAARHGAGAEDVILLHVAQHLVKQAPKGSFVCRWTGPSILAVNTPSNDPQQDARVWNQIAAKAVEGTITNERRSLMIKINLSCMARVVEPGKQMPALFAQMDQFVAEVTKG